jgi:hypothetical protein
VLSAEFRSAMAAQFLQPIEQVVQQHEPQRQRNDQQIEAANPLDYRMGLSRGDTHMNRADGQLFANALVALAASLSEICRMDG